MQNSGDSSGHGTTNEIHVGEEKEGPGERGRKFRRTWKNLKSMDGKSPTFTIIVLIAAALALLTLFQERGFLEGREDAFVAPTIYNLSPAVKEVMECILILVFAVLTGILTFVMLYANFDYIPEKEYSRRKAVYVLFAAFIAMTSADILAVFNLIGAERAFQWRKTHKSFICPISHYFLVILFALSMLSMNVLFMFVIVGDTLKILPQRKRTGLYDLSEITLVKKKTGVEDSKELGPFWKVIQALEHLYGVGATIFVGALSSCAAAFNSSTKSASLQSKGFKLSCPNMWGIVRGLPGNIRKHKVFKTGTQCLIRIFTFPAIRSNLSALADRARAAESPDMPKSLLALKGLLMKADRITGQLKAIQPSFANKINELWNDAKQDDQYKHPAWLISAVVTACILIIYYGVRISTGFRHFMNFTYLPFRACLIANQAYIRKSLSTMGFGVHDSGHDENTPVACFLNGADRADLAASEEFLSDFNSGIVANMITSFDIIIRSMNWTVYIGLLVGLLSAVYSLVSVLAQYKRISLAVRSGYFDALVVDRNQQVVGRDKQRYLQVGEDVFETKDWSQVVETYPMSSSMFFFGILVSTAVAQLLVFGFSIATGLAVLASIAKLYPLTEQCMALLIAFGLTWLLNDFFAQWIFGEGMLQSKYEVYRERGFVFFLLVYGMVHLVLGILFALSRLVMLILSSLISLNRLDRNLYTYNKGLDQGHRSFVATVLLHAAFDASVLLAAELDSSGSDGSGPYSSQLVPNETCSITIDAPQHKTDDSNNSDSDAAQALSPASEDTTNAKQTCVQCLESTSDASQPNAVADKNQQLDAAKGS